LMKTKVGFCHGHTEHTENGAAGDGSDRWMEMGLREKKKRCADTEPDLGSLYHRLYVFVKSKIRVID
jgi:hypothetical protein